MPKKRSAALAELEAKADATPEQSDVSRVRDELVKMAETHEAGTPERSTLLDLAGALGDADDGTERMGRLAMAIITVLLVQQASPVLAKDRERMQAKAKRAKAKRR